MPMRSAHKHGTPSWVDLSTTDRDAARAFYGELFGWSGEPAEDPRAGGYVVFMLGEHAVAGCMQMDEGMAMPCWNTYVTVNSVDETVAAAREAGAGIRMEGCDVMEAGRMAVLADPGGAVISLWEAHEHIGAMLIGEPGTLCWNELATRNTETAQEFYGKIFGWEAMQVGGQNSGEVPYDYYAWKLSGDGGGEMVGGMIRMDENWPAEVPAHWMTYFAVEHCDNAAKKVTDLGGRVCVPPTDIPPGRFAVVEDPQKATFTIIQLNEQMKLSS